jgi:hypothetical protein
MCILAIYEGVSVVRICPRSGTFFVPDWGRVHREALDEKIPQNLYE